MREFRRCQSRTKSLEIPGRATCEIRPAYAARGLPKQNWHGHNRAVNIQLAATRKSADRALPLGRTGASASSIGRNLKTKDTSKAFCSRWSEETKTNRQRTHLIPRCADLLKRPDGQEDGGVIEVGVEERGAGETGAELELDRVPEEVREGGDVDQGAGGGQGADRLADQPGVDTRLV